MDILFNKGVDALVGMGGLTLPCTFRCPVHALESGKPVINVKVTGASSDPDVTDNLATLPYIGSLMLTVDENFSVDVLNDKMTVFSADPIDLSSKVNEISGIVAETKQTVLTLVGLLSSDSSGKSLYDQLVETNSLLNDVVNGEDQSIKDLSKAASDCANHAASLNTSIEQIQEVTNNLLGMRETLEDSMGRTLVQYDEVTESIRVRLAEISAGIISEFQQKVEAENSNAITALTAVFNERATKWSNTFEKVTAEIETNLSDVKAAQKSFSDAASTLYSRVVEVSNTAIEQIRSGVLQEAEASAVAVSLSECLNDFRTLINGVSSLSVDLLTISQCTPALVNSVNALLKGIETNSDMVCETGKLQNKVDVAVDSLRQLTSTFETTINHLTKDSLIASISSVCSNGASIIMEGVRTANTRPRSGSMNSVL